MDRTIVYPGQQPTDVVWLSAERNAMVALGYLAQGVLGTNTVVDGLACIPTVPPSLAVQIGAGAIYAQESIDGTAYGSLPMDSVDMVIKQGIALAVPNLTLSPPATSGQAINYLIQAEISETDTGATVLPYFNSAAPTVPFTGPNGSGVAQPTLRQCTLVVQAKAGTSATAGSQVTPAPDAGFVGLYVVTVANGATALTSAQISVLPTAPFIAVKLPGIPAYVQSGSYLWSVDTGTANAMVVTLSPAPPAIVPGMGVRVKKMASVNTAAMTVNVNGFGTQALVNADGSPVTAAEINGGFLMDLVFDGTSWRFMNGTVATSVGSLTAQSGEGVNVDGSAIVSLNYPGLTANAIIGLTDLLSYYNQTDSHHRGISFAQFAAAIATQLPPFAPMATLPEHLAGTLTTKTTNPAGVEAMINDVVMTLAPNGSYTLPGGLILKWGRQASQASEGAIPAATTFQTPFPNAVYCAFSTLENAFSSSTFDATVQLVSMSKSSLSWLLQYGWNASGHSSNFSWFAIGS